MFLTKFREMFAENLVDIATDPDAALLEYLAPEADKILRGEKVGYDANIFGAMVRLGQDARVSFEEMDKLKSEFFIHPKPRIVDLE